jgi:glycosyltransferase involved in cell wall biosynthesis
MSSAGETMKPPRIDQLLAAAHDGDATGDAALALAGRLRASGYPAGVFAPSIDAALGERVEPLEDLPAGDAGDTAILHFNVPSPLGELLASRPGRRLIVYHNLTPPELLVAHCPQIARLTALGRRQLGALARSGIVDLAIGVSEYNTRDLVETGFRKTATLPLPIDLGRLSGPGDPVLEAELARTPMPTFITVGRVAPNKRIEDFLKIAAYYLRYVSPEARFLIVGGTRGLEPYLDALVELHGDLQLDQRVRFTGKVSLAGLISYYRAATAYVCTSAHEGFCAPLLEAMSSGVPIVARRAAAVPETLGGAGVLIDDGDPAAWAEMLRLVAADAELRGRLVELGARRVRDFDSERVLERWVRALGGNQP